MSTPHHGPPFVSRSSSKMSTLADTPPGDDGFEGGHDAGKLTVSGLRLIKHEVSII